MFKRKRWSLLKTRITTTIIDRPKSDRTITISRRKWWCDGNVLGRGCFTFSFVHGHRRHPEYLKCNYFKFHLAHHFHYSFLFFSLFRRRCCWCRLLGHFFLGQNQSSTSWWPLRHDSDRGQHRKSEKKLRRKDKKRKKKSWKKENFPPFLSLRPTCTRSSGWPTSRPAGQWTWPNLIFFDHLHYHRHHRIDHQFICLILT